MENKPNSFEVRDGAAFINAQKLGVEGIHVVETGPSGNNGVIFYGEDRRLERQVVIKFWFVRSNEKGGHIPLLETRKPAQFSNDNIAQVFSAGEIEGYSYAVFERVKGITLNEWLNTEHTIDERFALWSEIAKTMKKVHEAGYYHGDLHTNNILIDKGRTPKIIDFGSSKKARSESYSRSREGKVICETTFRIFKEYSFLAKIIKLTKTDSKQAISLEDWIKRQRTTEVQESPEEVLELLFHLVEIMYILGISNQWSVETIVKRIKEPVMKIPQLNLAEINDALKSNGYNILLS